MPEINKPNKRTFWRITNANESVVHEGFTEINQVTTTGQPNVDSSDNAGDIYPNLPSSGILTQGEIYSHNGGMVIVEQTHERTIYPPEETPALFTVYRANAEGSPAWVENEQVIAGDKRTYNSVSYKCIQGHLTQANFSPDQTPALWVVDSEEGIPVWVQPTGAHDDYDIGAKVHFPTLSDPVYVSIVPSNVWAPNVYGWELDS